MRIHCMQTMNTVHQQIRMIAGGSGRPNYSVLYKFKEGYTNAVRRPVYMKDLL